ncbi:hypothetical protein H310_11078 [Aphanomyces invadans]|uniref:TRP C-terminal domain-containing protein n=1 Tax=Aphanomyces invadans TaxID=157072 RepID=A0A024TNS2_9STRA|nr:hypothetical protein H310_11078 [Aphanomyces invadans]ETV95659.1 hypothetical protein H310_11078 [Aphanomyces invadans]|eukprot:XP_008875852.1 hypothetical protein H310_11078 [Aphanomyces invadans]
MKAFTAAAMAVLGAAVMADFAPSSHGNQQMPSEHVSFAAMDNAIPTTTSQPSSTPSTTVDPDTPSTTSASVATTTPTPSATSITTPAPTIKPNGVTPTSTTARPASSTPSTTSSNVVAAVQCPFIFTSAIVTTEFNAVLDEILANNAAKNSSNTTDTIVGPLTTTNRPTTSVSLTTSNTPTSAAPSTTVAPGDESVPNTAAPTTGTPAANARATTTWRPTTTTATLPSIVSGDRRLSDRENNVAFACDASFYGKWITSGLTCGGADLDVEAAVKHAACATYRGDVSLPAVTVASCLTTCAFPSCINNSWAYKSARPGFGSAIYANFDFSQWFTASMTSQLKARTQDIVNFHNFSMAVVDACRSPAQCTCPVYIPPSDTATNPTDDLNHRIQEAKKQQVRAADFAPQTDWVPHTPLESVASFTASVTQYATFIGVATSASAVAVSSIVSSSAVVTSSGAAAAAGSAASLSVAVSLLDMASFVTSVSQLNVERLPPPMGIVAASISPFQFSFFTWESAKYTPPSSSAQGRSLATASDNTMSGMERYAATVGVRPDQLFYVTLTGICVAAGAIAVVVAIVFVGALAVSNDFTRLRDQIVDRGVGACMLLAVVGQYAIGVTATFEITQAVDVGGDAWGVSVFVAMAALLVLSVGTIVYGYLVVRQHEHDLRDIGTKDHYDKSVHRRYGCLYDEYNFANRFFFVVKMLLALSVGITTGLSTLSGLAQVVALVGLHVVFVLYLEVRQPHLAKFVQAATTLITVLKIAALGLTAFLLSAVVQLPPTARTVVGYVIVSLQGLVVVFLVVRQGFIVYRQWKLKQVPDPARVSITDFYGGSSTTSAMAKLDGDPTCADIETNQSSTRRLPPLNHPGKEYTF